MGSATVTDLLKVITSVVNLWLAGRCLVILAEFVAFAPLTPLLKPDNGIRLIAVGTIWRRLVSTVAMKGVVKEMSKYLSDFQFRVGVSGGAEAVLHSVNRLLSEYHNDGSLAMLIVDFSNAFNLKDRSALLQEVRVGCPSISLWVDFLYGQATRLCIGDTHIWSATGVQQGDPLGPLLLALLLHPLVHKIRDSCKLLLHVWYLDDETIIGDSEEVVRVLEIIKLREGLFPVDIRRPSLGVKLLGGDVSRDAYFICGVVMRRAVNAVDLMSLLPQLHDPQSGLVFDKSLCGSIENIVVYGGPFFGDLHRRLASLPIGLGGLGLYLSKVAFSYAFVASRAQSWVLQDHILRDSGICDMNDDYVSALACLRAQQTLTSALFSEMVKDMEAHFDMTVRHKAVFECLRSPHAQDFLLAIPIDRFGQHISLVEYRIILKYRLMISLFSVDAICPVCRHVWIPLGIMRFIVKSSQVSSNDTIWLETFFLKYVGMPGSPPRDFLTDPSDGRSTLRPTDVLVFGWVGGEHACVDLTGVSPPVGLSGRGFTVGRAALKAALMQSDKTRENML
ncbi:putative reverse transcriptase domain-containing protein [Tanacetum coccineum]